MENQKELGKGKKEIVLKWISLACSLTGMIAAILNIIFHNRDAVYITNLLLGISMSSLTIQWWNRDRKTGIVCLVTTITIFISVIAIIAMRILTK